MLGSLHEQLSSGIKMTTSVPFSTIVPELMCKNVDVSIAFYINVLGFNIRYQRPETRFAMVERQGGQIMLDELVPGSTRSWIAGPLEAPFGRGMNLEIDTNKVDDLYAHVQAAKADIFLPMEEKWYRADDHYVGVKQFIVQDPDGYLLRFSERLGSRPTP